MATRLRYVNTASGGGDGTTNGTGTGGTNAYASLSAAIAAEAADLTGITTDLTDPDGNAVALKIICAGATADATAVTINQAGWVTNSSHRLWIAGDGNGAKWDTAKYRLERSATYGSVFRVAVGVHLSLSQVQIGNTGSVADQSQGVRLDTVAADVRMVQCFVRLSGTGTADAYEYGLVAVGNVAHSIWIRNSTISAPATVLLNYADNGQARLSNCTLINRSGVNLPVFDNGFRHTVALKNLILQGATGAQALLKWGETPSTQTQSYILTQDTSGTIDSKTLTFVDAANWDYHLAATDTDAINAGASLAADGDYAFSDDADGVTRSGTWDVGADEYVAAASFKAAFARGSNQILQ